MSSLFCQICNSTLSQKTSSGMLLFQCLNCSFERKAAPEETLLEEEQYDNKFQVSSTSVEDIINNETCQRIPIDCKCGSRVGVIRVIGEECSIMKICVNCKFVF